MRGKYIVLRILLPHTEPTRIWQDKDKEKEKKNDLGIVDHYGASSCCTRD